MVSFQLWGRRIIAKVNGAAILSGMALIGTTTFLPMYVQVVLKHLSVVAGLALTMVMLGWPIGATLASRTFQRFGLWRPVAPCVDGCGARAVRRACLRNNGAGNFSMAWGC